VAVIVIGYAAFIAWILLEWHKRERLDRIYYDDPERIKQELLKGPADRSKVEIAWGITLLVLVLATSIGMLYVWYSGIQ